MPTSTVLKKGGCPLYTAKVVFDFKRPNRILNGTVPIFSHHIVR
jgi:hypothetical protein